MNKLNVSGRAPLVTTKSIVSVLMSLTTAVLLAACNDTAITDNSPVLSTQFSVSGGNYRGEEIKVCKDNSGVPPGSTFQYSVSTSQAPVTVTAGQCVVVIRSGPPVTATVSELSKAGFTADSVKVNRGSGLALESSPVTCTAGGIGNGCVIVFYGHANAVPPQPTATYSGEATVVRARVLLGVNLTLVRAGPLPPSGGADQKSLLTANVPSLLTARLLSATTQAGNLVSQSAASVKALRLGVAGIAISSDLITSGAVARCINGAEVVGGSSVLENLFINGVRVVVTGAPNQTINLGIGRIIINEQIRTSDSITVNALHIDLGILANVVISQAHADIHC